MNQALLNYNTIDQQMFFVQDGKALIIGQPDMIRSIMIDSLKFVPIKGDFFLLGAKKPITERKYRKLLRYLDRIGFIREGYNDPFPETESYNNLVPPEGVIVIDDNLIEEV